MEIQYSIDLDALKETIDKSTNLNDNEEFFGSLSTISEAKADLKELLEKVESIESEAKNAIKSKAKQLYGTEWRAIAGTGYKITRSYAGSVYSKAPDVKVAKKFIKVVESIDTKVVDLEIEKTGKLPKGLDFNMNRTEVIRIAVKREDA